MGYNLHTLLKDNVSLISEMALSKDSIILDL